MRPPPFLLGAALLFWGWQSGLFLVGALLAVILEGARVFKVRWDFSDEDFNRIWTFCALLLFGALLYAFSTHDGPSSISFLLGDKSPGTAQAASTAGARTIISVIRWLPMIFYPFLLLQTYSTRETVPLSTISLILQKRWKKRKRREPDPTADRGLNVGYPYFCATLLAASFHPANDHSFFWGFCTLLIWALWTHRSRRFGWAVWLGLLLVVAGGSYFGQRSVSRLQQYVANLNPHWFARFTRRNEDANQSRTALGMLGRIKNSGKIVIRATPRDPTHVPQYLREASYRLYRRQTWLAGSSRDDFQQLYEEASVEHPGNWTLLPEKTPNATLEIACYLDGYEQDSPVGLLPLPAGTARLENLHAYNLMRNSAGSVRAFGPGLVVFEARYGPGKTIDSPPGTGTAENPETQRLLAEGGRWHHFNNDGSDPAGGRRPRRWNSESNPPFTPPPGWDVPPTVRTNEDLEVPLIEQPALDAILAELQLPDQRLATVLPAVSQFFDTKFKYQTWQTPVRGMSFTNTPLAQFLLTTRAGHCEYFATATALLLRRLGIPTRYAIGYALHEKSGSGYVVRMSDAHAWTLVWDEQEKVWRDFDTTPAAWIEVEHQAFSPWQWWSDLGSRIAFEFSKIRNGQSKFQQYLIWLVVPALALLLYQIIFQRGRRRATHAAATMPPPDWPGADSDFYRLEQQLAARGVPRGEAEPLRLWLHRALRQPELLTLQTPLEELLRLHYRHRFDPLGLSPDDRAALRRETERCLERLSGMASQPAAR